MYDDAVPDDARRLLVEYAGRKVVELVLLPIDHDGVSGVGPPGDPCAYVVFL